MPLYLAQPCLEKWAQKLGQWPARPEVGSRFGISARQKGKGLQIVAENAEGLKARWVRGLVQHHMARWWQTGMQFLDLHCPASWLLGVFSYPYPKQQDHHTCLAWVWLRHWRVFQAFLVYESSYSSTGFFLEDNWLQRDSHSFCFIHLFSPEHLTQFLAFNRYSIDRQNEEISSMYVSSPKLYRCGSRFLSFDHCSLRANLVRQSHGWSVPTSESKSPGVGNLVFLSKSKKAWFLSIGPSAIDVPNGNFQQGQVGTRTKGAGMR